MKEEVEWETEQERGSRFSSFCFSTFILRAASSLQKYLLLLLSSQAMWHQPATRCCLVVSHGPYTSKALKTNNKKQKLKWHLLPIWSCILICKRLLSFFSTETYRKAANAFLSFSCLYPVAWQPVYLYKLLQFMFPSLGYFF